MVTYQTEGFDTMIDEWKTLAIDHWNEIALNKDKIKLNLAWDKYKALDDAGTWFCVTVRDDGKMVGYFIGFIMPHLHYIDNIMLFYDIFYLKPDYRKGMTGIKLFQVMENEAKKRGVVKMYVSTKLGHDIGRIFEYLGYTAIERVYSKMIG